MKDPLETDFTNYLDDAGVYQGPAKWEGIISAVSLTDGYPNIFRYFRRGGRGFIFN